MNHVKENKEKLFKESQVLYELKREEQRLKNEVRKAYSLIFMINQIVKNEINLVLLLMS